MTGLKRSEYQNTVRVKIYEGNKIGGRGSSTPFHPQVYYKLTKYKWMVVFKRKWKGESMDEAFKNEVKENSFQLKFIIYTQ